MSGQHIDVGLLLLLKLASPHQGVVGKAGLGKISQLPSPLTLPQENLLDQENHPGRFIVQEAPIVLDLESRLPERATHPEILLVERVIENQESLYQGKVTGRMIPFPGMVTHQEIPLKGKPMDQGTRSGKVTDPGMYQETTMVVLVNERALVQGSDPSLATALGMLVLVQRERMVQVRLQGRHTAQVLRTVAQLRGGGQGRRPEALLMRQDRLQQGNQDIPEYLSAVAREAVIQPSFLISDVPTLMAKAPAMQQLGTGESYLLERLEIGFVSFC